MLFVLGIGLVLCYCCCCIGLYSDVGILCMVIGICYMWLVVVGVI